MELNLPLWVWIAQAAGVALSLWGGDSQRTDGQALLPNLDSKQCSADQCSCLFRLVVSSGAGRLLRHHQFSWNETLAPQGPTNRMRCGGLISSRTKRKSPRNRAFFMATSSAKVAPLPYPLFGIESKSHSSKRAISSAAALPF